MLVRVDEKLRWKWVFNPGFFTDDTDPLGKTANDYFEKESADRVIPLMRQAFETGQTTSFEGIVKLKRGDVLNYRARYVPVTMPDGRRNLLIKGYNFSQLAQAQADLALSEARFRVALEHEPLSLSVQNRWGEFLWTYNIHALWPISPDNRMYQNMERDQMAMLLRIKRKVIDTGQPFAGDMWLKGITGGQAFIRLVYHPYRLPDGTVGVIGKKYDLTPYRLAEERERETAEHLAAERKELRETLSKLKTAHAEKLAELEEARQTQLSLLPQGKPTGIDYAIHYETCVEVGGDYYDYFEKPAEDGDGLLLAVGDATGHGMRSAMLVSVVKGYLQLLAHAMPPARLLERIDKAIKGLGLKRLYMGLLLLERRTGGYAFASAGMPGLLVYRHAPGAIEEYLQARIFLGTELALPPAEEIFVPLAPGDILLALSDGIIEAVDPHNRQLGLEPIRQSLLKTGPQGCQAVITALIALQSEWQGRQSPRDDTTLMAVAVG